MNRIASRAGALILLAVILLGGFGFFLVEYLTEADDWVILSGSPHVYTGGNIGCGVVVDRDGILLLDTRDDRVYSNVSVLRQATVHWLGDRYGNIFAPALPYYASELAGFDMLNGVYNYADSVGVAGLTLSSQVQTAALDAMGSYKGTVAVINYETGQLLCAVTTPTYDPDAIPDLENDSTGQYEGLYVNRFTMSTYIPGSIFKIVTLAAALEEIPDITEQTFTCTGSYVIGNEEITCEGAHWDQNLKSAFCNSCNCAFAQIALQLGAEKLEGYVAQFGVVDAIAFDGVTTATGNFEATDSGDLNVAWSSIGQHKDQINPCAFLTFMGAVANDGTVTNPYLVEEITVGNTETYEAKTKTGKRIMSAETAKILQEYLQNNVLTKYGADNFPGLTVGAKTGTGEVGGDKKPNAMLAGYVADSKYPLAFLVCVEDAGYGKTICMPIATQVLEACKQALS
ncbi:MAG: penicillin-binding protein [Oscillospiraceae bacterium]|nr:penicillin-binding protein [Oscillospiraceae bacterium]